jgi:hypothetical protein
MSDTTRRGFVKGSAAAAAGATVLGSLVAEPADAALSPAEAEAATRSGAVVAYVRDAGSGEIALMSGDREVNVRDRKLAARIARAAG